MNPGEPGGQAGPPVEGLSCAWTMRKLFPLEFLAACIKALSYPYITSVRTYGQYLDYWGRFPVSSTRPELDIQRFDTPLGDDALLITLGSGSRVIGWFEHVHGNEWINHLCILAIVRAAQQYPAAFRDLNVTIKFLSLDGDTQRVQRTDRRDPSLTSALTLFPRTPTG